MQLRCKILGGESIPFAQIGEKYIKNPEFVSILQGYPGFFQSLQIELQESQGDIIRMAQCIRELMCIDMISKVTDWGNITPEDMMKLQGMREVGDAYSAYQSFQKATKFSQAEIEQITLEIEELETEKQIEAVKCKTKEGASVINLEEWRTVKGK